MRLSVPRGNILHIPYSIPELRDTLTCQQRVMIALFTMRPNNRVVGVFDWIEGTWVKMSHGVKRFPWNVTQTFLFLAT